MNCPFCKEQMTKENTHVSAELALHDPTKIDLIVIHETRADGEDCGASFNAFVETKDGVFYDPDGHEIKET